MTIDQAKKLKAGDLIKCMAQTAMQGKFGRFIQPDPSYPKRVPIQLFICGFEGGRRYPLLASEMQRVPEKTSETSQDEVMDRVND